MEEYWPYNENLSFIFFVRHMIFLQYNDHKKKKSILISSKLFQVENTFAWLNIAERLICEFCEIIKIIMHDIMSDNRSMVTIKCKRLCFQLSVISIKVIFYIVRIRNAYLQSSLYPINKQLGYFRKYSQFVPLVLLHDSTNNIVSNPKVLDRNRIE